MSDQKLAAENKLSLETLAAGSLLQDETASDKGSSPAIRPKCLQDTAIGFDDTSEIPQPKTKVLKKSVKSAPAKTSSKLRRKLKSQRTRSAFAIRTEPTTDQEQLELDGSILERTFRGMPSWLTSLILHLSLILILALLTVGSDGRKIVDLLASAADQASIEPYAELDIELETEDLETLVDDSEFTDASLTEPAEVNELLDDAFTSFDVPENINAGLLDAVTSDSISDVDPANPNKSAAQFFGVEGSGSNFVYIIDCSGSMAEYGRWKSAVRELKSSIKALKSKQRFLILLYNTGFVAMNNKAELVASTQAEQKRAMRWLSRKSPNDWTFCAQALAKALTLKPDAIFLLSDGEFDDRRDVFLVLDRLNNKRRLISANEKQIPVHTIALGSHHGRFTMKRIADENSGEFRLIEQ